MIEPIFDTDLERLIAMRALLAKSEWERRYPPITPLAPADADRRKQELQVAYLQYRLQAVRGEL